MRSSTAAPAAGTLTAAGSGNDILIGEAADTTLTDTGTGRNILIGGGAGGDSFVGDGNDILVSGTTEYDSYSGANLAALDAILAEWASSASYTYRIRKIKRGVGPDFIDTRSIPTPSRPTATPILSRTGTFCSSRPTATPMLAHARNLSLPRPHSAAAPTKQQLVHREPS